MEQALGMLGLFSDEQGRNDGGEWQAPPMPDYYNILGLPATFDDSLLRKAFRKTSVRLHPDKPGGNKDAFEVAAEAHAVRRLTVVQSGCSPSIHELQRHSQ
jgi:hypothetical protein